MSTKVNQTVGSWSIVLIEDDDGHLTITAQHADGTQAVEVDTEVGCSDKEYGVRLTTAGTEDQDLADALWNGYENLCAEQDWVLSRSGLISYLDEEEVSDTVRALVLQNIPE